MDVTITAIPTGSRITMVRRDGSRAETTFPPKGPFPHDAVHFAVERALGLRGGFWGMVAAGRHPEEIAGIAKAAGHASAKRAELPDAGIVQLLQAERLVECFEAEIWAGPSEPDMLRSVARVACEASHVPLPDLNDTVIAAIRAELVTMAGEWASGTLSLSWPENDGQ